MKQYVVSLLVLLFFLVFQTLLDKLRLSSLVANKRYISGGL